MGSPETSLHLMKPAQMNKCQQMRTNWSKNNNNNKKQDSLRYLIMFSLFSYNSSLLALMEVQV